MVNTGDGALVVARLVAGMPTDRAANDTLPEPWQSTAHQIVTTRTGDSALAAFEKVIAGRPDAAHLRAAVLACNPAAKPESSPPRTSSVWTHADLMRMEFAPLRWRVDGLVPDEGLTFLGGKKKRGKSWLCLQIAQAAASGGLVLGRRATQGTVLYLALEDGPRRLRWRLSQQHAPADLPIVYVTRFEPLDGKGMADLERLVLNERPHLLIIDTLAAAKSGRLDENSAGSMGDILNALRDLGQDQHLALLVTAHHGKTTLGDPGDDIRGSSAIAAAADVILGLYKTEDRSSLKAEGRDMEPLELRIAFDTAHTWSWQLVGDARQIARQDAESEILDALAVLGAGDAGQVARETGKTRQAVQSTLMRLRTEGKVEHRTEKQGRTSKVMYSLPIQEREE